jgi:hypothetical protein
MPSRPESQTLVTAESRKFADDPFTVFGPRPAGSFLLGLPTVPGTAKPVKSKLQ